MSSRRLISWFFALTLLFGQAAAFAHALTHVHTHDPALPDKVCEVCIAQAQLGTGIAPHPVALTIPPGSRIAAPDTAPLCIPLAPRTACARAPPTPIHT